MQTQDYLFFLINPHLFDIINIQMCLSENLRKRKTSWSKSHIRNTGSNHLKSESFNTHNEKCILFINLPQCRFISFYLSRWLVPLCTQNWSRNLVADRPLCIMKRRLIETLAPGVTSHSLHFPISRIRWALLIKIMRPKDPKVTIGALKWEQ